uniref:Transposase n=1 Tax=Bursaphelenchus xylophilus TaxID=6326 RepID=A0A1I7SJ21_BURXY
MEIIENPFLGALEKLEKSMVPRRSPPRKDQK